MLPDGTGVMYVDFNVNIMNLTATADKTAMDVYRTLKSGGMVIGRVFTNDAIMLASLNNSTPEIACFIGFFINPGSTELQLFNLDLDVNGSVSMGTGFVTFNSVD